MNNQLLLLGFALMLAVTTQLQAQCKIDKNTLGAHYLVEKTFLDAHDHQSSHAAGAQPQASKQSQSYEFDLWRNGLEVAHQYPAVQMTEIWNRVVDGRVRPIRYFDADRRAIEYQPEDLNRGKGDRDWDSRYQLISMRQISQMKLTGRQFSGCELTEHYTLKNDGVEVALDWLPAQALIKSYREKTANQLTQWSLKSVVTDKGAVQRVFSSRQDYLSTDYADIGDNHNDPFLLKMVNLGFVEEASGFYNADGDALQGRHH